MRLRIIIAITALLLTADLHARAQSTGTGPFRVGAAKVDTTPTPDRLPKDYLGVLDHVYSRAIVIDNGRTSVALVSLDAGAVPNGLWKNVSDRIQKNLGISAVSVLITATHSHSVPLGFARPGVEENNRSLAVFEDQIVESVKVAKEKLQPAQISFGTGLSFINVQRDIIDRATHGWWEGANYGGISDKTVAVIKFETLDGQPIAVYYNYAVHAVITGTLDMVSGDIPGATSRYLEGHFGDKVVALWSEGASGDQNPIYFQQTYDLRAIRIKEFAKRGIDISNSMPPGGQGLDRNDPEVQRLMDEQKQMIGSMGQMLGEEVLRVMRESKRSHADGRLLGKIQTVKCPGRERTGEGRGGIEGTYKDGPPIDIKLGLLMIDDIAIGTVDAEVYNTIAQRLKAESPYTKTMMATLTNGMAPSGYIPDDASYGHYTFEVLSSRLKAGCAETAIVDGIIQMMPRIEY
ncbi:neutral/alkaline non-lysosomal ceramidase N-terminal domain-containing protein [Terriglobus saanensis]|uniref:Neutral ceramidase n=1 Tax=Terriglobus saanensis (strain ATCC BAA-1853 / DSM 23119 / SP1PR4) TaxID=401053 RepID=E8UXT1_TERSS|nr:neutral/alkaline non-lysosomal ceramidase N-terminal domain-containing protein [Terriglobus saanensis]ADV83097.1 hypothetical protein AciPR4_2303 [Terriglobus saanensis SP1PR4]